MHETRHSVATSPVDRSSLSHGTAGVEHLPVLPGTREGPIFSGTNIDGSDRMGGTAGDSYCGRESLSALSPLPVLESCRTHPGSTCPARDALWDFSPRGDDSYGPGPVPERAWRSCRTGRVSHDRPAHRIHHPQGLSSSRTAGTHTSRGVDDSELRPDDQRIDLSAGVYGPLLFWGSI